MKMAFGQVARKKSDKDIMSVLCYNVLHDCIGMRLAALSAGCRWLC